jgi:hypothetical protein
MVAPAIHAVAALAAGSFAALLVVAAVFTVLSAAHKPGRGEDRCRIER